MADPTEQVVEARIGAQAPDLGLESPRHSRRWTALPDFDETGHHLSSIEPWRSVRTAIDRLPESYRTVLSLRDLDEIAPTRPPGSWA